MLGHTSNYLSGLKLRKKRHVKRALRVSLVALVVVLSLFYVWQRVQVIAIGYEIEELKKQKDELVKANRALSIEVATLTSPERVEAIAKRNIGMTTPDGDQIVMVRKLHKGTAGEMDGSRRARAREAEEKKPGA